MTFISTAMSSQRIRPSLFLCSMGASCPTNYNPGDFFIQLLAVAPTREDACRQVVDMVCDAFQASEAGQRILEEAEMQWEVN